MKLDLHVHSNYSDGSYSLEKLVELFKGHVNGFALTDHDTIDGIEEALNLSNKDFFIIPGIEFSCKYKDDSIHILGLNIDYKNNDLQKITKDLKNIRCRRALKIIENLTSDNININIENIIKNKSIGRPHIAKELINRGYSKDIDDAFENYLSKNSKYYVSKKYLEIEDAINYIHSSNGTAILAHPGEINNLDIVLKKLENTKINGIEIYHPSNSFKTIDYLLTYSKKRDYIITGGSDFHSDVTLIGEYYTEIDIKSLQAKIYKK